MVRRRKIIKKNQNKSDHLHLNYLPFKCNFCILNFHTRLERNGHSIQHLKQKQCATCDKTLIQIGDEWFELKLHVDENCKQIVEKQECFYFERSIKIEQLQVPSDTNNISTAADHENNNDSVVTNALKQNIENENIDPNGKSCITFQKEVINGECRAANTLNKIDIDDDYADFVDDNDSNQLSSQPVLQNHTKEYPSDGEPFECTESKVVLKENSLLGSHVSATHLNLENTAHKQANQPATIVKTIRNRNKRWYQCEVCEKEFHRQDWLEHLKGPHRRLRFKCKICNKICQSNCDLQAHIARDHLNRKFLCDICKKQFGMKHSLRNHMKIHAEGQNKHKCEICGRTYASKHLLADHKQIVHERKVLYECQTCGKNFSSKGNLNNHMKIHSDTKPFTCDYCGAAYRAKGNLMQHLNLHTGHKPYICSTCGEAFPQMGQLHAHKRRHTRDKKYVCNIDGCDRAFINWTDRKRHRFTGHGIILENESKHICQFCSKTYPLKSMLMNHLKSH